MTRTATMTSAGNTSNLSAVIDAYGELKAMLAELAIKERDLKNAMADLAPGAYEGTSFRLSISVHETNRLDMEAVREKLSPQFIRAHTITSEVRTLKVSARSGKKLSPT